MTTCSGSAPELPLRARADPRKEGLIRKARAPSPVPNTAEESGNDSDDVPPPPIPPRLPPRTHHSLKSDQRSLGRTVHGQRLSDVFLLSDPNGLQLSGTEFLRQRPPPPPRNAIIDDVSSVLTLQPVVRTSGKSNHLALSADADLVWWPSREQHASQIHQLTHWPISSLSAITNGEQPSTGPRKMNDYVDSPIAVHSDTRSAGNGVEVPEVSNSSEILDTSFDHHLWPTTPLPATLVPSTKTKTSSECSAETPTQCQQRIICELCGKCRCQQCTDARPLPRCWAGECECSARSAIDCCTCMCCARALFYHCRTTEEDDFSDDPCACTEQRACCKRWTLLTLLSFCLPCLCFYCPLNCAMRLCTAGYNRCHGRGCRCRDDKKNRTEASKGLLLVESESSSS